MDIAPHLWTTAPDAERVLQVGDLEVLNCYYAHSEHPGGVQVRSLPGLSARVQGRRCTSSEPFLRQQADLRRSVVAGPPLHM